MKNALKRALYAWLGFSLFFFLFDLPPTFCLLFLDGVLALSLFYFKSHRSLFSSVLRLVLSAIAAFVCVGLLRGYPVRPPQGCEEPLGFLAAVLGLAVFRLSLPTSECSPNLPQCPPDELFREQKYDLDRLRQYVSQFRLLGVNARWGNGKSFLWARLCADPEIREAFEVVQIDLLTVDLDSVELILIDELEKLLERHGICPQSSRRLKVLLSRNSWLQWAGWMLDGPGEGLAASFEALRQDLARLDKGVLIGFEDIDRIQDPENIKKIFAIAEKLACTQIHLLFQYNADLLTSKGGGLDQDYLEKYLPHTVSLTPISFESLIHVLWVRWGLESLPLEENKVKYIGVFIPSARPLNQICGLNLQIHLPMEELTSIRKVRDYLLELKEMVKAGGEFAREENVETVAYGLFLKHFFPDDYSLLKIGESPLDTFFFQEGEKRWTLPGILKQYQHKAGETAEETQTRLEKLQRIFEFSEAKGSSDSRENSRRLALLMLLGYDFSFSSARSTEIFTPEQRMEEKNRKIDHLIWNLIANGGPELTDAENDVAQLEATVLSQPPDKQLEAWDKFRKDRYYGSFPKNNQTVERLGDGPFVGSFRAIQLAGSAARVQSQFLPLFFTLYLRRNEKHTISLELLDCLVCCDLTRKQDFFVILKFFNSLAVAGTPAAAPVYRTFFLRYFQNIPLLGYCNRTEYWMLDLPLPSLPSSIPPLRARFSQKDAEEITRTALSLLEDLHQDLSRAKARPEPPYSLRYVQEEYALLLTFVEKNQELLQAPSELKESRGSVKTSFSSSSTLHQKEMDRLKAFRQEQPELFEQEAQKSYEEGKLYLYELEELFSGQSIAFV